jgi:Ni,Fe-hydrogenase I small subunit
MATLTPTLTLASTDVLSDPLSFSVTDSLSVLGAVKTLTFIVAHPGTSPGVTDILTASAYNKSYVYMKNLSTTASEIITIGKKSTNSTVNINSNTDITMDSTANISRGMSIIDTASSPGIPNATTIATITSDTAATISKSATATTSNITARFGTETFLSLGAEEFAFFPWDGTVDLEAISSDGTPTLEVMIFEATA